METTDRRSVLVVDGTGLDNGLLEYGVRESEAEAASGLRLSAW